MTRGTKKDLEYEILRKVYSRRLYPKYTPSEKPDFIIHGNDDFGVEIVEYYPDQTVARLHNKPDYAGEITNMSYIHKDDVKKLEVVTAEYQDRKTGKWKKIPIPAVMQENLPITDRLALLVQLIESKGRLLSSYNGGLTAVDLVLQDSRNTLLDGINDSFTLSTLTNFENIDRFNNTGFRFIHIILPPSKGVEQKIVRVK